MDSGSVVKSTGKGNGWAIMVTNTKVSGTKAKGMVKVATNGLWVMNSRRTEGCIMKVSGRWIKDTVKARLCLSVERDRWQGIPLHTPDSGRVTGTVDRAFIVIRTRHTKERGLMGKGMVLASC